MYSLFFVLLIPSSIFLYRTMTKYIIGEKNISDFSDLKNSVRSVHPEYNKIKLYYETLKLVFYKYRESYLQYKFGIVRHENGNMFVNYYKNHTLYTIVIKKEKTNEKKIKKNILIFDENNKD